MAGKVVAAGEERVLVERRGDDAVDLTAHRELDRAVEGASGEPTGLCLRSTVPVTHAHVDGKGRQRGADEAQLGGRTHARVGGGHRDDLRADTADVAQRDGEPRPIAHERLAISAPARRAVAPARSPRAAPRRTSAS